MTLQSELQDPLYKHWLKGGFSVKLLRKGLEKFVDESIKTLQSDYLSDICNHLSLPEAKCTECTTANCLPCLPDYTTNVCKITGKGKNRQCSYHDKYDNQKKYRPCPNRICAPGLREKIQFEHNYNQPSWKNTDATKWCTAHWEIAKCFMTPQDANTESAAETDYSGLLHIIINCQRVFYKFTRTIRGHFDQLLQFRNDLFHDALFSLSQEKLDCHIDLMIDVLQDNILSQDPDAQRAVDLLIQLKSGNLSISTKDESEILAEQKAEYEARKLKLQTSLCDIYEDNFKFIPISPLLDEVEADIDDVYEEMIVCNPDSCDTAKTDMTDYKFDKFYENIREYQYVKENKMGEIIKNYKGIFYKDDKSCKDIYILGEAGMGKTTWCMKMLRTWVKALKKGQADLQTCENKLSVDKKIMSEFDIVLFVSLRDAVNDGNIRDMIRNQLYQERPNLDSITSEVLKNEASKCLVILDGFDEWSPPDNSMNTSTLQNAQIPGRQDLYGCPVLTTTRSFKMHQVRLQKRDMDKIAKIEGLRNYESFAKQVIKKKSTESETDEQNDHLTYPEFKKEVERSLNKNIQNISFLRLPMILLFMLCSWFDNGHLEKTWARNFSGVIECMILGAEKTGQRGRLSCIKDIGKLKSEWSKNSSLLPRLFQDRRPTCINYSQLILNLAKLAFYTLFDPNIKSRLRFTEELTKKWLSIKELEIAVKIGILTQQKVSKTLTRTSNISFLHKTIQEHLAAVHLCSNTDDCEAALKLFKECCCSEDKVIEYEHILMNIYGMNIQVACEVSKHIAKNLTTLKSLDTLKLFAIEMEGEQDTVRISPLYPIYVAKLSQSKSNSKQNIKLEIIKTHISCQKDLETRKDSSTSVTFKDINETQTWLPNQWTSGENSPRLIALLACPEKDEEINRVNLSHYEYQYLEAVTFKDTCFCDIYLPQTKLSEITIEGGNKSAFHINNTVETSGIQQPPLKRIKLEKTTSGIKHPPLKRIKLVQTNNCTITLSESIWKIDCLEFVNCDSCKFVIQAEKLRPELHTMSEIDQLCLQGSKLKNFQIEKEDFQLSINHLKLIALDLQNIEKSFENFLQILLSSVKEVSCINLTNTVENWKMMQAAIPYLHRMEKLHLDFNIEMYHFDDIGYDYELYEFGNISSSTICSLQYAKSLKELELWHASAATCNALAKTLPNMTQLEKITLRYNIIGEDIGPIELDLSNTPSSAVVDAMKWLPSLTDITIYDNTGVTLTTLPLVLPHLTNLRKLKINWKNIDEYPCYANKRLDAQNLMVSLQHVKSLREFDFTKTYLPPLPQLEILTLTGSIDYGIGDLSSLSNAPNLRHLHLVYVKLSDVDQLKQFLPKLIYLESLEFKKFYLNATTVIYPLFVGSLPKTNHPIEVKVDNIILTRATCTYTTSDGREVTNIVVHTLPIAKQSKSKLYY